MNMNGFQIIYDFTVIPEIILSDHMIISITLVSLLEENLENKLINHANNIRITKPIWDLDKCILYTATLKKRIQSLPNVENAENGYLYLNRQIEQVSNNIGIIKEYKINKSVPKTCSKPWYNSNLMNLRRTTRQYLRKFKKDNYDARSLRKYTHSKYLYKNSIVQEKKTI